MSGRGARWRAKAISALTTTIMIAALLLAAVMMLPTILGYERYVIISGSMEPTIPVGAVVYDEVVPVDELEVGDIITFVPPPEYGITTPVTHRVFEITITDDDSSRPGLRIFRTKGDANPDVDPWKMALDGDQQGRYVRHVPYVGYVYMALQVRWVQILVIAVPALGLVAYLLVGLWRLSADGVLEERRLEEERQQEVVP